MLCNYMWRRRRRRGVLGGWACSVSERTMKQLSYGMIVAVLLCGEALAAPAAKGADPASALRRYVEAADDSYQWVTRGEADLLGGRYAELTLTSQTWQGIRWRHRLFVFKPAVVRHPEQALMMITGGSWHDRDAEPLGDTPLEVPGKAQALALLATRLGSPLVVIAHVPFQPMFDGMHEDRIIAYTFQRYLETGDDTWPLLLPMVKTAVRAMDAAQAFAAEEWQVPIKRFMVTGASKRGWTTWLTAAVDQRVNALAPMVIDVLNMAPQMQHQLDVWGKYSHKISDYTERGLPEMISKPEGEALRRIVDPYAYRQAITQPKLIMIGTNDQYWTIDALNLYWQDLADDKHILYVPNTGHGLNDMGRVMGALTALHQRAVGRLALPQLRWAYTDADSAVGLDLRSDVKPVSAAVWVATAPKRDFREATWQRRPMEATADGYRYQLEVPAEGFAAFFGEAKYEQAVGSVETAVPYYLSTTVRVVGASLTER